MTSSVPPPPPPPTPPPPSGATAAPPPPPPTLQLLSSSTKSSVVPHQNPTAASTTPGVSLPTIPPLLPSSSLPHNSTTTNNNHNHDQQQQQPHGSRLTRFLSKFTPNNLNSKRKASLPNLSQGPPSLLQPHSAQTLGPPRSTPNTRGNKRTEHQSGGGSGLGVGGGTQGQGGGRGPTTVHQHHQHTLSDYIDSTPSNFRQHLLSPPLQPTTNLHSNPDGRSLLEESGTDIELDGADPNASIRPITPSSKAASTSSPINLIGPLSPSSLARSGRLSSNSSEIGDHHSLLSHSSTRPDEPDDELSSNFDGNASSLASTKPTTIMSLDTGPGPGNRIAQAHAPNLLHSTMAQPSVSLRNRAITHHHHQRLQSGSSSVHQLNTPSLSVFPSPPVSPDHRMIINVPKHSLPHPSQNPHPAALSDNASMLTLASSGFEPSMHTTQNFPPDEDASVRALAPSRRESTESLSSRYSSHMKLQRTGSTRTNGGGSDFYIGARSSSGGLREEAVAEESRQSQQESGNTNEADPKGKKKLETDENRAGGSSGSSIEK